MINIAPDTQITLRALRVTDESEAQAAGGDGGVEVAPVDARLEELEITPGHVILEIEDERDAQLIGVVFAYARRGRELFERTVAALTPEAVPSQAAVEQMRRNAEARHRLLAEHGTLTSEQVADTLGSQARNRAATAYRLQRAGKIFGVRHREETVFPAFQFSAGGVRRGVPEVLRRLQQRGLSGWEIALWFTAGSGFLGGRRPLDVLDDDPELVIEHAARPTPY